MVKWHRQTFCPIITSSVVIRRIAPQKRRHRAEGVQAAWGVFAWNSTWEFRGLCNGCVYWWWLDTMRTALSNYRFLRSIKSYINCLHYLWHYFVWATMCYGCVVECYRKSISHIFQPHICNMHVLRVPNRNFHSSRTTLPRTLPSDGRFYKLQGLTFCSIFLF